MLDVVHYFLDEDMRYSSMEELKLHDNIRKNIFNNLYEVEYRYGMSGDSSDPTDLNSTKPYIPPTEVDPESATPFGSILDSPLG